MPATGIHQNCAARGLETEAGRLSAEITGQGPIRTSSVLLAGGAWLSLFCRRHGIELPVGLVNATACRTTPAPEITPGALGSDSTASGAGWTAASPWRCAAAARWS